MRRHSAFFVLAVLALVAVAPLRAAEPMEIVARLCAAECGGRLAGTDGERRAAAVLATELAAIGAEPLPGRATFGIPFPLAEPLAGEGINVVGRLAPRDAMAGTVLLCAHYDHLGDGRVLRGASLPGEVGRIHPGADDNASGVAAALRAAQLLAADPRRRSGVVVALVSAEEAGAQGSKALAAELREGFHPPIALAINLDQVGRLRDGSLHWEWAGDANPSAEPPAFLAGAAATTAIPLRAGDGFSRRTDGESFAAVGIPTLCLYTGPHDDVHRPTDTPDRLDAAGIERVAALVALAAMEKR